MCLSLQTAKAEPTHVVVGYLGLPRDPQPALSVFDEEAVQEGLLGARVGLGDNVTTGRLLGQTWTLIERMITTRKDAAAESAELISLGVRFILSDLDEGELLRVADSQPDALFINVRESADSLRAQNCRVNILHTIPNRAMLADALAQYTLERNWTEWFLVVGTSVRDRAYAQALHRAAERFGTRIVEEKSWTLVLGAGRSDTGHVTLQSEIPVFTRAGDHDVLVVADEENQFGEYLLGRTARPQLVIGTHGLVATSWSPVLVQWGARQLQDRFQRSAGRRMTAVDYAAWLAMRSIGEAVLRQRTGDIQTVRDFLTGPDFALAGYKGMALSFRSWDGQLRQPILIAGPRLLVSVSPQIGILHQHTSLDTLGFDREDQACRR
jgi:ABC transporter substrate binding protein (PQQ-dependent alcohol dehydrogenase system)